MSLSDLSAGDLSLQVSETDTEVRVEWRGRANARRPAEALGPFLDGLVDATKGTSRRLAFHFESSEHVNSSTIALVMQFAQRLRADGIALHVSYDADRKWQKLTFGALRQLETGSGMLTVTGV